MAKPKTILLDLGWMTDPDVFHKAVDSFVTRKADEAKRVRPYSRRIR